MPDSSRSFWKGYLRLALVSIPVRLVSAERTSVEIKFHQVDRVSKQRIRYVKSAPGRGEVAKEDIATAYEFEPGNYVFIEEDELDALKLPSRHTIELTQFVDAAEIDPLYFDRPYYLLPDGEIAEEGYRVLRDALYESRKLGIGQLTLRGRENLVALFPDAKDRGLIVQTLRYAGELKDAGEIFSGLGQEKPRADMVQMAEDLIRARSESFDPKNFKNHYAQALRELVGAKLERGEHVPVEEHAERGAKILDFMEALKRSVGASGPGPESPEPQRRPPQAKAPGRKTPAKKPARAAKRRA
jgi:DNA end-binding protein Ku